MAPIASSCSLFLPLSSPSTWKCPASWTLGLESPSKRCGKRYSAIFVHIKERRSALSFTLENENKDCDPPSGSPLRTKKRKKVKKKDPVPPMTTIPTNSRSSESFRSMKNEKRFDFHRRWTEFWFWFSVLFVFFTAGKKRTWNANALNAECGWNEEEVSSETIHPVSARFRNEFT